MAEGQDTEAIKMLKQYHEQPAIKKALSTGNLEDLNKACYAADTYFMRASVNRNTAHMEAAAQLFINLRTLGANEVHVDRYEY